MKMMMKKENDDDDDQTKRSKDSRNLMAVQGTKIGSWKTRRQGENVIKCGQPVTASRKQQASRTAPLITTRLSPQDGT